MIPKTVKNLLTFRFTQIIQLLEHERGENAQNFFRVAADLLVAAGFHFPLNFRQKIAARDSQAVFSDFHRPDNVKNGLHEPDVYGNRPVEFNAIFLVDFRTFQEAHHGFGRSRKIEEPIGIAGRPIGRNRLKRFGRNHFQVEIHRVVGPVNILNFQIGHLAFLNGENSVTADKTAGRPDFRRVVKNKKDAALFVRTKIFNQTAQKAVQIL